MAATPFDPSTTVSENPMLHANFKFTALSSIEPALLFPMDVFRCGNRDFRALFRSRDLDLNSINPRWPKAAQRDKFEIFSSAPSIIQYIQLGHPDFVSDLLPRKHCSVICSEAGTRLPIGKNTLAAHWPTSERVGVVSQNLLG